MKHLFISVFIVLLGTSCTQQATKITCIIEGETINRPQSNQLVLARKGTDYRTSPYLSIPVVDGKFSHTLQTDANDAYELIFWDEYEQGAWMPTEFLAENGHIHFTLYPMDSVPHVVIRTEAPFNKEIIHINRLLDSLFDTNDLNAKYDLLYNEGRMYSDAYNQWIKDIRNASTQAERDELYRKRDKLMKEGLAYSEEGKALNEYGELLIKNRQHYILNFIKEKTDIVGYYFLNKLANSAKMEIDENSELTACIDIFKTSYRDKFPSHPLTDEMERLILSMNVKTGGRYIDFTAPDLNGNSITLSEQISGKIALIDLWASWCGPCRRSSISMIPVYEEFKNKGFTIIGIARERDNTEAMQKAIAQDKYPWLNLVELNDSGKIWELYGVGNAGGETFLVDTDGTILAIHPTAEEVKSILASKI